MTIFAVALVLVALLGHAAIWIALVNRVHAVYFPRWIINLITLVSFSCLPAIPLALAGWALWTGSWTFDPFRLDLRALPGGTIGLVYLGACSMAALIVVPGWLRRQVLHRPPHVLRSHRTQTFHIGQAPLGSSPGASLPSADHAHHFLAHLPGNQSLRLEVTEKALAVPRLSPALDGLSVVHLSDLHFTGRVGKAYFQDVVRLSNDLQPDLVAITGDLVDRPPYIDWIPDTLGRLRARHGVYFVLGNHDMYVDTRQLLEVLEGSGLIHLGGRWTETQVRGERIILAGNELPWFPPAADLAACPPREVAGLRLLLAHSPDQLAWARAADADLLLAGHMHGGQIRLPLVGPIFAPSRTGVRYACGLFHAPPTIMHVTRGVSGQHPLRWNCAPELAHLVLQAGGCPCS